MAAVVVSGLFVYPIKGCAGIPVQSAAVTSTGDGVHVIGRKCAGDQCHTLVLSSDLSDLNPHTNLVLAGLPYDRQWMVVRESNGKFVTQRQIPKLCKVGAMAHC